MSYALAMHLPGSVSRYCRCSSFGLVNGWCMATQRASSSSYSNIGKSITHSGFHTSSNRPLDLPNSEWPIFRRRPPMASFTTLALSAPKKMMSPSWAPVRFRISAIAASCRFLTIGDCRPSRPLATSLTLIQARPLAP
ncbi:hypothetical protein D3C85_1290760 [compost metagenome]